MSEWKAGYERKGREAYEAGAAEDANPYHGGSGFGSTRRYAWRRGWTAAHDERQATVYSIVRGLSQLGRQLGRRGLLG